MAQREWRLCYVHLVEGCTRCQDRPRPTREEWERQVMNWALSEDERRWLGRYDRARRDLEVAASRGGGRSGTCERGLVVAHEIGDVFKKAATGLPRILCRRVSKPAHPIVLLGGLPSSGARIRSTSGTVRGALAGGTSIVDASERLTPEQYRLIVQETDQARDDAMEAQNLAESACVRAAAAEAAASRSELGRREMMERLRHLEPVVCGGTRSATPSRQEQGPWPTRRQRQQRGGSDYAPAADTQPPAQESSQERRA
ncbi:hypothetical protein PR001_g9875 [Phytophthora rubi]|uniref:Uncharacterized protein n=1 Tax=Phytophthora rubi TaxID=129364 RepID=A0A6A3KLJ7_9STRA|nr:hypothetical protein PR002_g15950 [Phytophthora rubi]KAE9034090.1 hypothetical protein PR001_g9875 [Phytophthora rubi]